MLIVSIVIYLGFSLILYPRIFEKGSFSRFLLIFFISIFSINILISELLGLLHCLNHPWIFLLAQVFFCGIVLIILQQLFPLSKKSLISIFAYSENPLKIVEILLFSLISVTFLGFFAVGITTPINNVDSLATHLPRIFYWLQHGSFDYWTTVNQFQLAYPINAHIQGLWLFLFGKSENLFFLVQWFSLVIISASTYEISRMLGFSRTQSLLSTLIGLSFPIVLLQTFSFQGDLTVTALIMVFITFLIVYYQTNHMRALWVAILCHFIALGTKQSAFITIPLSIIVIIYLLVKKKDTKSFLKKSWLLLIIALLFTSFQFIQNTIQTHTLSGMDWHLTDQYTSLKQVQQKSVYVIPRYIYQFVGIDALPRSILPKIIQLKANSVKAILSPLNLDLEEPVYLQPGYDQIEAFSYTSEPLLSEDTAWFGPMAFLLIPLAMLFSFFSKNKIRRKYTLFSLIFALFYFLTIYFQRPGWDPYQGRYFILGIYPLIPLISILLPKQKLVKGLILVVLVSCSVLLIYNTLLKNDVKPIITAKSQNNFIHQIIDPLPESNFIQVFFKKAFYKITYPTGFENPRRNIYSLRYYYQLFYTNTNSAKNIELINSIIPDGESLSIMIPNNPLEYALFGLNRNRSLYPVKDITSARPGYLVVYNSVNTLPTPEMQLIDFNDDISIYWVDPN